MRIAVLSASALPSPTDGAYGALENIAAWSAEALAQEHDVTLIGAKGTRGRKCRVIETVEPSFTADAEQRTYAMVKDFLNSFDMVLDHSHQGLAFQFRIANPSKRAVHIIHDLLPAQMIPWPEGSFDALYGVSQFHARLLSERWGTPVGHVYNGIPVGEMEYSERKDGYLLFLGRMDVGKGAHLFPDIARKSGMKGIMAGDDDPAHCINITYRDTVMHECVKAGVDYMGTVDARTKKEMLAHADALVLPYTAGYAEVFGVVMLEALASGTPVIAMDAGSPRELLTDRCGHVSADMLDFLITVKKLAAGQMRFSPSDCRERATKFGIAEMGRQYIRLADDLQR